MKRAYQILTVYTLSLFAPMWAYAADVSNDAPPPKINNVKPQINSPNPYLKPHNLMAANVYA